MAIFSQIQHFTPIVVWYRCKAKPITKGFSQTIRVFLRVIREGRTLGVKPYCPPISTEILVLLQQCRGWVVVVTIFTNLKKPSNSTKVLKIFDCFLSIPIKGVRNVISSASHEIQRLLSFCRLHANYQSDSVIFYSPL